MARSQAEVGDVIISAEIRQGHVLTVLQAMLAESVHCVVTSPPYWGLRDYGLSPLVWGGDLACEHEWGDWIESHDEREATTIGKTRTTDRAYGDASRRFDGNHQKHAAGSFCSRCGAWRGSLGLEPTPELYIEHLVAVFREVRRVLRDDGTVWLNLGDSYASIGGHADTACNDRRGAYNIGNRPEHDRRDFRARPGAGLKPKDLVGIPWRVALALQADGWWLRSDIVWAKCLSGGAWVYARTQKGEMPMMVKDMARLDPATVHLWDGQKWNPAVGWEPVAGDVDRKAKSLAGRQARYRGQEPEPLGDLEIQFRNGERIGCTREHRWPTQRGLIAARHLTPGDVVDWGPLPAPPTVPSCDALDDDLVGWFVGMYLAEGSQSDGTIQMAGHVREELRTEKLRSIAALFHGTVAVHRTSANGVTANLNGPILLGILDTYIAGRIASDKHLHPRCWQRSNRFLYALLTGYLEGDGCLTGKRWRLSFCQNDHLAIDLRTLAGRLGASIHLQRVKHKLGDRLFPGWRGDLVFDPQERRNPDGQVVAIRQSRARRFWKIALRDEPHVYALASGLRTGNCNPMPESVTDRPTKAHEYLFLLSKAATYYYDAEAVKEPASPGNVRLADPRDKREVGEKWRAGGLGSTRNLRSVWWIATQPYPEAHFATFPEALVQPCILAGTSERGVCPTCGVPWERISSRTRLNENGEEVRGRAFRDHPGMIAGRTHQLPRGERAESVETVTLAWRPTCDHGGEPVPATVLDPFAGSGTTLLVAQSLGRSAIGIELNPEYIELAEQRLRQRVIL